MPVELQAHRQSTFIYDSNNKVLLKTAMPQFPFSLLSFSNSDNVVAKLCFAAGDTPCLPIIDSSTASESSLFSITAFSISGTDPSFEKLIANDPWGDSVKRIEEPGGKVSSLKTSRNFSMALASASV